MSFAAAARAMDARPSDPIAKLVLIGLSDFTDENHVAELDLDHLAAFAGIHVTQCARCIDLLMAEGFVRLLDVPGSSIKILGVADGD